MATAGSLPPLSSNGKTFINDPKISLTNETKASIKLKFLTPKDKEVIVVRNFQLSIKNRKYEFKRLEQVLKSFNQNGELVTINSSCMDIDKQIPLLMHASKAILENVIFCHQEEINWPFSEAGNLKKVFDEIFDTAKYTKALEELKDTNKIFKEKSKELKNKIELIKKDVEQYNKVKHMIELSEKKVFELNDTGKLLDETYKNSSKDLEKILELEKNYKEYENGIKLAKAKKEEKKNQMETILSDPMFEDYTKDEITFKNYLNNFQENDYFNKNTNNNSKEKMDYIEKLNEKIKVYNNKINNLNAKLISKEQIYNNYKKNKDDMILNLNSIDSSLKEKINNETSISKILEILTQKEKEIKEKENLIEEKMKQFTSKEIEKENDISVNKQLYENKIKEIESLSTKKDELFKMISNVNINNIKIDEIENSIKNKQKEIKILNYDIKTYEDEILLLENKNSNLSLEKQKLNLDKLEENTNKNFIHFQIQKLEKFCISYNSNSDNIKNLIYNFNKNFQTSFNNEKLSDTLNKIIEFCNNKKEEIIEQKQKIREEKLILNFEIEQEEKNLNKKQKEEAELHSEINNLINEVRGNFSPFGIQFDNINDINQINNFKKEIEKTIEPKEKEFNSNNFEITFLENYIDVIVQNKNCSLCFRKINEKELQIISNKQEENIQNLKDYSNEIQNELDNNKNIISRINDCSEIFNSLKQLSEQLKKITNEINEINNNLEILNLKKKEVDNNSKKKNEFLQSVNEILNNNSNTEDIYKIKTERNEITKNIIELCSLLKIEVSPNSLKIDEIISKSKNIDESINKILNIENNLQENSLKINELNHKVSSKLQEVTKLNLELKDIENEKSQLLSLCDENEIKNRIKEIEAQIALKTTEKINLESESTKIKQLMEILKDKKDKFDILYKEKKTKYKTLLQKISNCNVKIEYINNDFNRAIKEEDENNEMEIDDISTEELYKNQIEKISKEKNEAESQYIIFQKELEKLSNEAKIYEDNKKQKQLRENIYKNNTLLYKIKNDLIYLDEYIKEHESKLQAGEKLSYAKELLTKKVQDSLNQYNLNLGKLEELKSYINRLNIESKQDSYKNIEKRYNKLKLEYIMSLQTTKEIENFYEALDQSLLKYHGKRMEEINKLINYYWTMTYKGKDIKYIEIRSDYEKIGRSRNYNYRIVFGAQNGELDMRGRCSAGQKILASIIIRLALAETFCNNCGILCLDEPTTNLDDDNSRSLANSLREIIQSRSEDRNFQLIVITHDPVFVDLLGSDYCDSYYQVRKDSDNFSKVSLKPINSIFGGK